MYDNRETAEELNKLRALTPPSEWARDLRARVLARIDAEPTESAAPAPVVSPYAAPSPWLVYRKTFVFAFVFLFIVTFISHERLFAEALLLHEQFEVRMGDTEADRSRTSLTYLDTQVNRFKNTQNANFDSKYAKVAIENAQNELGTLKLMGDPGKYTQAECFELYKRYDTAIDTLSDNATRRLLQQVSSERDVAVLNELIHTLDVAHAETQRRINLYPPTTPADDA
jgi:hypothetical protein